MFTDFRIDIYTDVVFHKNFEDIRQQGKTNGSNGDEWKTNGNNEERKLKQTIEMNGKPKKTNGNNGDE